MDSSNTNVSDSSSKKRAKNTYVVKHTETRKRRQSTDSNASIMTIDPSVMHRFRYVQKKNKRRSSKKIKTKGYRAHAPTVFDGTKMLDFKAPVPGADPLSGLQKPLNEDDMTISLHELKPMLQNLAADHKQLQEQRDKVENELFLERKNKDALQREYMTEVDKLQRAIDKHEDERKHLVPKDYTMNLKDRHLEQISLLQAQFEHESQQMTDLNADLTRELEQSLHELQRTRQKLQNCEDEKLQFRATSNQLHQQTKLFKVKQKKLDNENQEMRRYVSELTKQVEYLNVELQAQEYKYKQLMTEYNLDQTDIADRRRHSLNGELMDGEHKDPEHAEGEPRNRRGSSDIQKIDIGSPSPRGKSSVHSKKSTENLDQFYPLHDLEMKDSNISLSKTNSNMLENELAGLRDEEPQIEEGNAQPVQANNGNIDSRIPQSWEEVFQVFNSRHASNQPAGAGHGRNRNLLDGSGGGGGGGGIGTGIESNNTNPTTRTGLDEKLDALEEEIVEIKNLLNSVLDSTNNVRPQLLTAVAPIKRQVNRMYLMLSTGGAGHNKLQLPYSETDDAKGGADLTPSDTASVEPDEDEGWFSWLFGGYFSDSGAERSDERNRKLSRLRSDLGGRPSSYVSMRQKKSFMNEWGPSLGMSTIILCVVFLMIKHRQGYLFGPKVLRSHH